VLVVLVEVLMVVLMVVVVVEGNKSTSQSR
jgi:hypothetical protein